MATRNIMVVGATGQQGGAVVKALLGSSRTASPLPRVLALTRNMDSGRAKSLASTYKGNLELVQGDTSAPKSIFEGRPKGSVHALFLVTTLGTKVSEEKQAIPMIDAAVEHGVQHIVFSSVDRGGDERSWNNPTNVQHFLEKHNVEIYLRDKAEKTGGKLTWTILRPVAFLDNMNPGAFCSMFTAMWAWSMKPETKLQLVGVKDIGVFAAMALTDPAKWAGKAVSLAGDSLTLAEAKAKFGGVMGKPLPQTFSFLGGALLGVVKEVRHMFQFFEKEGYGADIPSLEKLKGEPMENFEMWLQASSKWQK